jgi:hypothetical protein
MDKLVAIIAMILMASASFADEPTFDYVQNEFQQKAVLLLSPDVVSDADFNSKIVKLAEETFGAHPDVMRNEAERRFKSLPQFHEMNLNAYVEHKSWDLRPLPPIETGLVWLLYGCDPEKLADWAKKTFRARQLSAQEHGRLSLLNACCPDKVYRLDKGKFPDLVVNSLGDLFVSEVEMTEVGACKPVSVKWMKKKECQHPIAWRDFSLAKLKELRGKNKPVLVFCRADWDLTCEALDRTLFTDRRVIDEIKQRKYISLRADCSKPPDEMVKGFLRDVGWVGTATVVVFRGPKNQEPVVLRVETAHKSISPEDLLDAMKP